MKHFFQRKVTSSDFKQKETTLEIEIGACIGAMPSNWFILFQKFQSLSCFLLYSNENAMINFKND